MSPANISQYFSVIAGNLFGLGKLDAVRLLDIEIPTALATVDAGPKFDIEEVRRIVGTKSDRRLHVGTIIKPKVGLNPRDTANVAYEVTISCTPERFPGRWAGVCG